ncbi:ImmA/IrrE family metallo-endopeptidase [Blautia sp. JLR.GB0024]|uniref:ImmA/IrrE family metallo-endopeptidase n=1 Tax=Blautia sp. JLR.GB0024 TaxID=3123295 RepID=UPI0030052881
MEIGKKVDSLVRKYQTRNPFEMIKGMNVILVSYPLDGVRGFYQYFQRNNIIYIDENLPEHEKLFVCAHELGHMFLHKKSNAIFMDTRTHFTTSKYETEANNFAIHLLLSDDFVREYQGYTFGQISRLTGYSEKLIELRLK